MPTGGADLRTDGGKFSSPDSEQMEPAKLLGLKAELCERGANPRQREEF